MPSPTLTRRALIAGTGATIASTALAVPFAQAAFALQDDVRSIDPAILEAIADWNHCQDATALAWAVWDEREVRTVYHGTDARYLNWVSRREEAEEALAKLLKLLRSTDLDLGYIYRRA